MAVEDLGQKNPEIESGWINRQGTRQTGTGCQPFCKKVRKGW